MPVTKKVESNNEIDAPKNVTNSKDSKKKSCFIITPIGNKDSLIRREVEGIFRTAILPALVENGYLSDQVCAANEMFQSGNIDKQIVQRIINDTLVIANLTDTNPNVMYELAIRHSIGKPLIIIARKDTVLPFDIKMARTFFYDNDPQGALDLKVVLMKSIENISDYKADNIIYETLVASNEKTIIEQSSEIDMPKNVLEMLVAKMNDLDYSIRMLQKRQIINTYEDIYQADRNENEDIIVSRRNKIGAIFQFRYQDQTTSQSLKFEKLLNDQLGDLLQKKSMPISIREISRGDNKFIVYLDMPHGFECENEALKRLFREVPDFIFQKFIYGGLFTADHC